MHIYSIFSVLVCRYCPLAILCNWIGIKMSFPCVPYSMRLCRVFLVKTETWQANCIIYAYQGNTRKTSPFGRQGEGKKMLQMQSYKTLQATSGAGHLTKRYEFVNTSDVVNAFQAHNWVPSQIQEKRTMKVESIGFQKHIIRFRNEAILDNTASDITYPEIVLVNSHNGTCALNLMLGIYRCVCTNGLIAGDTYDSYKMRHTGDIKQQVKQAIEFMMEQYPKTMKSINTLKDIVLTKDEQGVYAMAAYDLLDVKKQELPNDDSYNTKIKTRNLDTDLMLRPTRQADVNPSLWNTFNIVQEKIIKGGRIYRDGFNRRMSKKAITSIDENVRLNKALWTLTEKMAELKTA